MNGGSDMFDNNDEEKEESWTTPLKKKRNSRNFVPCKKRDTGAQIRFLEFNTNNYELVGFGIMCIIGSIELAILKNSNSSEYLH